MAVDISAAGRAVPWLDSLFEDAEHTAFSFGTQSNNITSLDEVFEERAAIDQKAGHENGYHRQQLILSSTASEGQAHYYTGSRSSSGESPSRAQSNSRRTSRSSHGSHSSPLEAMRGECDGEFVCVCESHEIIAAAQLH